MVKIPGNSHLVCEFTRVTFKVSKGHQKSKGSRIPKSSYIIINQQNIPASSERPKKFGNFVGDRPFSSGLVGDLQWDQVGSLVDRPQGSPVSSIVAVMLPLVAIMRRGDQRGFTFFCVTAL